MEIEQGDFSIAALLRSMTAMWEPVARGKGLTLNIENALPADTDWIRSDVNRLRQVLNNLIGNAIKFTHEGGVGIRVSALPPTDDAAPIAFEVRDTGIGIDEETRQRLFSPFTQADASTTRKYGGTGLGLSICKHLVSMLGGAIELESAPGRGSVFRFAIHAARAVAPAPVPASVPASASASGPVPAAEPDRADSPGQKTGLRILLAEDNLVNRKVAAWMLEPVCAALDAVGDGREAIAAAMRTPYDLILMDVQMPVMDGVTAAQRIRELSSPVSDVPIIALTANAMHGDRERYLAAGMNGYVTKPIDRRELLAEIRRCLGLTEDEAPDLSNGDENPVKAAG